MFGVRTPTSLSCFAAWPFAEGQAGDDLKELAVVASDLICMQTLCVWLLYVCLEQMHESALLVLLNLLVLMME